MSATLNPFRLPRDRILPSDQLLIRREWAMPNRNTFRIPCIAKLLDEALAGMWVDPFCGKSSPAQITNDANEEIPAQHHLDALDFLTSIAAESIDGVLFDPPYSVEQALRKYKPKQGGTAGRLEYQYACLRELARIVKPNGKAICFGWDSNGVGKKRGFHLEEILLIAHGAAHRDTIVTIERKQGAGASA